jgi:hypothetical protein
MHNANAPRIQWSQNSDSIEKPAHHNAANGKSDHGQSEWKRRLRARDRKFRLHGRERDHHRPHAHAADGRNEHRGGKAQPCLRRIGRRIFCGIRS